MRVRPYIRNDAGPLSSLYRRAVDEIGRRFYSEEQTAAWLSMTPDVARLDALMDDGRLRLVAVDEADTPIAFIDLEGNGHICFLYCAPEAAGRGVASGLYADAEAHACENGIERLFAEASEAALPLFRKKGFAVVERRNFAVGGVSIHNYAVEKVLSA